MGGRGRGPGGLWGFPGPSRGIPDWFWAVLGATWACRGAPGDVFGVLEVSAVSCWIKLSDQCGIVVDKIIESLRAFRRVYLYGCLVVGGWVVWLFLSWKGCGRAEDCRVDPPPRLSGWVVKLIGGWVG